MLDSHRKGRASKGPLLAQEGVELVKCRLILGQHQILQAAHCGASAAPAEVPNGSHLPAPAQTLGGQTYASSPQSEPSHRCFSYHNPYSFNPILSSATSTPQTNTRWWQTGREKARERWGPKAALKTQASLLCEPTIARPLKFFSLVGFYNLLVEFLLTKQLKTSICLSNLRGESAQPHLLTLWSLDDSSQGGPEARCGGEAASQLMGG